MDPGIGHSCKSFLEKILGLPSRNATAPPPLSHSRSPAKVQTSFASMMCPSPGSLSILLRQSRMFTVNCHLKLSLSSSFHTGKIHQSSGLVASTRRSCGGLDSLCHATATVSPANRLVDVAYLWNKLLTFFLPRELSPFSPTVIDTSTDLHDTA